jgi:hypothetical protein
MEDIVALKVKLKSGECRYLMTWGRIQASVDPEPLETLMAKEISFGVEIESVTLCKNLQEASKEPLFFEALFSFSQKKIPYGENYEKWRMEMHELMSKGKEVYQLGIPKPVL